MAKRTRSFAVHTIVAPAARGEGHRRRCREDCGAKTHAGLAHVTPSGHDQGGSAPLSVCSAGGGTTIALLRKQSFDRPLQYNNFRD